MAQKASPAIPVPPILQTAELAGHYANANTAQLHNINIELPRGAIATVQGGTGSGKSLLIQLLAGQATRTAGSVQVLGEDPAQLNKELQPFLRRRMTVLPHHVPLVNTLSVLENIVLPVPAAAQGTAQALQWCAQFSLDAQAKPTQLSYGQQKIVQVLRALSAAPRVLLLDDPVQCCDTHVQEHMAQLLLNVARAGTAMLITMAGTTMVPLLFGNNYCLANGTLQPVELADNAAPARDNLGFLAEPVSDEALAEIF